MGLFREWRRHARSYALGWILASLSALPAVAAELTGNGSITAVWANDGADKVTKDELRSVFKLPGIRNSIWDGARIHLFASANEAISVNIILEAAEHSATDVHVSVSDLTTSSGARLRSSPDRPAKDLFNWTSTDIELFYVRYLQIKGLSQLSYGNYDERQIPQRMQRPIGADGAPSGNWNDRPGADKFFPDIAVPMELVKSFDIPAASNQSIWCDVYVPRTAPPGEYTGEMTISEAGSIRARIPVELKILDFALPDSSPSSTMVATSYEEVARRYAGISYPAAGSDQDLLTRKVADRQFMLARRHRISLVDDNGGLQPWSADRPRPEWIPRLNGQLFTPANGYAGPGEGVGSDVFAVGLYGAWQSWWGEPSKERMRKHANAWEAWFRDNFPKADRFLYLADESSDFEQTERWAGWVKPVGSSAAALPTFATTNLVQSLEALPSVSITASWIGVGDTPRWDRAVSELKRTGRRLFLYNGMRPASGSFAIEDDGIALRELPWGQYKKQVDRWFFWNATYYSNYQGERGDTDVFSEAQTFGGTPSFDAITGLTGWNTTNGDGVLFYPGTDAVFPNESYGLDGPIASLRLKYWRRGIEDVAYIQLADAVDHEATQAIVERMVPKVLWETGVDDPTDPTWVRAPISWSTNPDDWEAARRDLARIILRH